MCVGIPARVAEVHPEDRSGVVDVDGVRRTVDLTLVLEDGVEVGSWVLLHVGFAMSIVDEDEAARTLEFLKLFEDAELEEFAGDDRP